MKLLMKFFASLGFSAAASASTISCNGILDIDARLELHVTVKMDDSSTVLDAKYWIKNLQTGIDDAAETMKVSAFNFKAGSSIELSGVSGNTTMGIVGRYDKTTQQYPGGFVSNNCNFPAKLMRLT